MAKAKSSKSAAFTKAQRERLIQAGKEARAAALVFGTIHDAAGEFCGDAPGSALIALIGRVAMQGVEHAEEAAVIIEKLGEPAAAEVSHG